MNQLHPFWSNKKLLRFHRKTTVSFEKPRNLCSQTQIATFVRIRHRFPAKKLLSQSSEKTNLLFGNVREINFTPHFSQAERVQVSNERQHRPFKTSSRLHYKQIVIKHPSFLKPSHGSCRRNRLRR